MSYIRWSFTLNNPVFVVDYYGVLERFRRYGEIRRAVYGFEVGEGGTRHLQGYLECTTKRRLQFVRGIFLKCHWEGSKGTPLQNFKYCTKGGKYVCIGDFTREVAGDSKRIILKGSTLVRGLLSVEREAYRNTHSFIQSKSNYDSRVSEISIQQYRHSQYAVKMEETRWISLRLFLLCILLSVCRGDTPANCTYDDIKGEWIFYETERIYTSKLDCTTMGAPVHKRRVTLDYPDIAVDNYGNKGTWTMIYNQGFEVRVGGRSYFSFSYYNTTNDGKDVHVTSYCDTTFVGRSRDITVRNWACFRTKKTTTEEPKYHSRKTIDYADRLYIHNEDFVSSINRAQKSWTAKIYPEYEQKSLLQMQRRSGSSRASHTVGAAKPSSMTKIRSMILPENFDWRNVSGINYVSPIRDQGDCGSCYAFASMAGLESRVRILTKNEQQPVFSVQDILECSDLSQACDGGFPYLIAGRYAQDVGVVLDECSPYNPHSSDNCTTSSSCVRHYTAYYRYVGGYYGACNEEEMKLALVKGGPIIVGFEVYNDFMSYSGGIYHHTGLTDHFNPLELTNHAVLIVGYGVDPDTHEKYWSVKNSWGTMWGEYGYFKIRRGNDECGIESLTVEIVPIPA